MNNEVIVVASGFFINAVGLVPKVKGLYRDSARFERWEVRPNNELICERKRFYDADYGSPALAYMAAMEYLYEHGELVAPRTMKFLHERESKKIKTGQPGVIVCCDRRWANVLYTVRVSKMGEEPEVNFYVGKLDEKGINLSNSVVLGKRQRKITEGNYRHKRRVPLEDVMPWKVNIK